MRSGPTFLGLTVLLAALLIRPVFAFHSGAGTVPLPIVPAELAQRMLEAGETLVFIDLRPAEEFKAGRLPGARSIPFGDVPKRYAEIPRTSRVILYCACSLKEVLPGHQFLWDRGYRNISVLEEGFPGWVERGFPVER